MIWEYKQLLSALREKTTKNNMKVFQKCLDCGRKLETDSGKVIGLGSVCRKKHKVRYTMIPKFQGELRDYALDKISELDLDMLIEFGMETVDFSKKLKIPPYKWEKYNFNEIHYGELWEKGLDLLRLINNEENEFVEHNLYYEKLPSKWQPDYNPKFLKDILLIDDSERLVPSSELLANDWYDPFSFNLTGEKNEEMCILETPLWDMLHGPGNFSDPEYPSRYRYSASPKGGRWSKYQMWFADIFLNDSSLEWPRLNNIYQHGEHYHSFGSTDTDDSKFRFKEEDMEHYWLMKMFHRVALEHMVNGKIFLAPEKGGLATHPYYHWMFDAEDDIVYLENPVKDASGEWIKVCDIWEENILYGDFTWVFDNYEELGGDFPWISQMHQMYLDNLQMTTTPTGV